MALRLVAELGGDGSGFERMLGKANMSAKKFGSTAIAPLKGLIAGAFTVGAISSLTKSTLAWAGKLRDVADALSVNVEWLQKMQNGAQLAGADIEDVSKFITEMNRAREESLNNPTGKDAQSFQRLGISTDDQQNLSTQAMFDKIVKAFASGATTQMVNDVQEVGGRSAQNLLAAFASQFENDAPIASEALIDQLDDIGDRFTILAQQLRTGLAPAIVSVAESLQWALESLQQTQSGFVDAMATLMGGAGNSEASQQLGRLEKYRTQVEGKVFAGVLTPEQGKAKLEQASRVAGLTLATDALDAFVDGILSESERQDKVNESIRKAGEAAAAARKRRENGAPQFDSAKNSKGSVLASSKAAPDALVKVGNFLGQNPGAVNSIADKTLQVNREQLAAQKETVKLMMEIARKLGGGGIGIPGI